LKLTSKKEKIRLDKILQENSLKHLPEELQYAAKYVADGGTDLKGLI
jgi:hypothetical protein